MSKSHKNSTISRRRRPGRPPKDSDAVAKRSELLAAALDLFSRHGYEGVTLAQIAAKANATPSLLHYYFESKAQVWEAALDPIFEVLTNEFQELEQQNADLEPIDALELVIRRFIAYSARHPEASLLLRRQHRFSGPQMEWLIENHLVPQRRYPRELIEAAQKRGQMIAGAPDHILQMIIGAATNPLHGRLALLDLYDEISSDAEAAELHANLVVKALFSGLARS